MFFALLMLLVSLLLIFLEFYLPGGVLGTAGGVIFVASLFIFSSKSTSLWATITFFGAGALLLAGTMKFALWRLRHSKVPGAMYANDDQEGYQASSFHKESIGKKATVLTSLRPSGYILVDGVKHQAVSKFGFVKKGETVEIVDGDGGHLIVRPEQGKK